MSNVETYDTERSQTHDGIKYVFVSKGEIDIIKAVQYRYLQEFLGYRLYNLGFGDYDIANDEISDESNSNNGDVYTVFQTVLNTVQDFFKTFPTALLMVQGSDSTPEFEVHCRETCQRHCGRSCKKHNRRIKIYRQYVNKNFSQLKNGFLFYGGLMAEDGTRIEDYKPQEEYTAVFLRKR